MPGDEDVVGAGGRSLGEVAAWLGVRLDPGDATAVSAGGGSAGARVTGVSQDSRDVRPGDLYVALAGQHHHGASFLTEAAARGAVGALVDVGGTLRVDVGTGLAWAPVADLRRRVGPLASWLHGHPSRAMDLLAVTGTNGKTSTAYLLRAGLAAAGRRSGLLSGVELAGPGWRRPASRTTAEACDVQRTLAELRGRGVESAAVEVSSHGLALHRVAGTVWRAAVFTNLGRDHLDLHGDMESYFAAKASLFDPAWCGLGVVSVDDGWGRRLVRQTRLPVVTFSASGRHADWTAHDVETSARGSFFRLSGPGVRDRPVRLALLGAHQVDNALAAIATLVSTGTPLAAAVAGVGSLASVPGRLQRVDVGQGFLALVDHVHNEAGQHRVLPYLRSLAPGRLVVVLGATGERDPGKRYPLGRTAGAIADLVVVTDESPHGEDAAALRDGVVAGARAGGRAEVVVEADRARALDAAVAGAARGDVVVVCGRGHETVLHDGSRTLTFDDRVELRHALCRRLRAPRR